MSTPLTTADRALYAERCWVVDLEKKLAIAEAASRPVFSRRMLEEKLAAAEERARRMEDAFQSERRRADAMEAGLASIERTARDIVRAHRAALAPPPEAAKRGGE